MLISQDRSQILSDEVTESVRKAYMNLGVDTCLVDERKHNAKDLKKKWFH